MSERPIDIETPRGSPVLAMAFATVVGMWTVGYFAHLPLLSAPPWVTLVGCFVCVLGCGFVFGRYAGRGLGAAVLTAAIVAVVNLMILGSLLQDPQSPLPSPLIWLPGFALTMGVLFGAGDLLGKRFAVSRAVPWRFVLAMVAVVATGLLVMAGGLVTGYDAGLSVPDWPSSFQTNMFLYPLSQMTGAKYLEHAHRLLGSLVGLTTIVLAVTLWPVHRRGWWRALLVIAVLAVIAQGVMGGLRVTEAYAGEQGTDYATAEHENTVSMILRVAHGVFGQMFLGLLAAIAVLTTRGYRAATERFVSPIDRTLGVLLILGLLIQLTLGAVLRHVDALLLIHISFAAVVLMLAVASGVRLWGLYGQKSPLMHRMGLWMMGMVLAQLTLGIAALVAIGYTEGPMLSVNALITTAHQAVGAALLCLAVVQTIWCARLMSDAATVPASAAASA
jgi:cytochrome c oxidase assembly protein subunit 15